MRRAIAMAVAAASMVVLAAAAHAEYGAFAIDEGAGKYGSSWNETNQKQADDAAIKGCNSSGCKIAFQVGPKQCGAIAMTEDAKIWGGAKRPTKAAAELNALQNCQKRTKLQCAVKTSECNR